MAWGLRDMQYGFCMHDQMIALQRLLGIALRLDRRPCMPKLGALEQASQEVRCEDMIAVEAVA